ncbi:MAG TPA: extracellular solute-binding protein [Anaerolineaceae bacterium]|nr:extracellular solute-binding protein [Anaerolineaceae bacterium]HPN53826.1 extracellular solute-binding protein [Anaerolineaceae bacterium]
MIRKLYLTLCLFVAASMLLAACSVPTATPAAQPTKAAVEATKAPAAEPTQAPAVEPTAATEAKQVTITIWHQWDGKYLEAIQKVFDEYTAQHPNVKIDLSKPEDVNNALKVAIPAGEGPDIIGWANDQIGASALAGNIVALDDFGVTMDFLKSTYEPAAVNGVVWKEKIWGLPETQEGIALIYNKDMVTEKFMPKAGDLNDLLEKAKAFNAANPDKFLVCNQGFGASDAYHVAPVYFGFGVPAYVDDAGTAYMNTPEAQKAAEWLVEFAKVSPKEQTYDICKANLKEGKVAMWWTGPWAIAGIEEDKINYGILPMGKPFVGIKTLQLTKNAVDRSNAEIAIDVMKYFTSAEVQKKLALINKTVPAQTAAVKDPEVAALETLAGFGAALNLGVPMANTPYASAQWVPVGDASVAIWNGAQTPAEALAAAQKAIEDAVAQMK